MALITGTIGAIEASTRKTIAFHGKVRSGGLLYAMNEFDGILQVLSINC